MKIYGFRTLQKRLEKSSFQLTTDPVERLDDCQGMNSVLYKREIKGSDQPAYANLAIDKSGNSILISFWRQLNGTTYRTKTEYIDYEKGDRTIIIPRLISKEITIGLGKDKRGNLKRKTNREETLYRKPIELPLDF